PLLALSLPLPLLALPLPLLALPLPLLVLSLPLPLLALPLPLPLLALSLHVDGDGFRDNLGSSPAEIEMLLRLGHRGLPVHLQRSIGTSKIKLDRWWLWFVTVVLQRFHVHDVVLLDQSA